MRFSPALFALLAAVSLPAFAAPPEHTTPPVPADEIKFAGLPPEKAAEAMTLPPGFAAQLFAGEPDIVQRSPSASMTGRGLVVEG